ncbi:TFIIB-type zinc ribbon-containing protein [Mycetocola sp. CAN_C7]|uniref:TFIIB-type zinc ribbon-containing protein n=1 Tax=Mycetocola sp. CAN_C7 TaxID=2787724 RepID=UPI0018CA85A1
MKCPNDSATLVMSERSGVEIDYCPECRGVWLDRGELDKIIDRAESDLDAARPAAPAAPAAPPASAPPAPWGVRSPQYGAQPDDGYRNNGYGDRERSYDNRDGYRRKKKESWLSDLFD